MIAYLHGGSPYKDFEFYRDVVQHISGQKIMTAVLPYATKDQKMWSGVERYVMDMLSYVNPHLTFCPVRLNHSDFEKIDLMFVPGGDGDLLKYEVEKRHIFDRPVFTSKKDIIYVGNSAGVNLLSVLYYSNDNGRIDRGLGLHDAATFCHYRAGKFDRLNELIDAAKAIGVREVLPLDDNGYVKKEVTWYSRLSCT